jgi:hypothetical protein
LLLRASLIFFIDTAAGLRIGTMSLIVYLKPVPGSEAATALESYIDSQRRQKLGIGGHEFAGRKLGYSDQRGLWCATYNGHPLTVPQDLLDYLDHNPDSFYIMSVTLSKGAGIVDEKAAFQGGYTGTGEFAGCSATVDNYGKEGVGNVQSITVTGLPDVFGRYFERIRTRSIYPTIWLERKPGWPVRLLRALRIIR